MRSPEPDRVLPRELVHELSVRIDTSYDDHEVRVHELLVQHHRVTQFVSNTLLPTAELRGARGVALAILGAALRILELAGGRVDEVTSADLRRARERVEARSTALADTDGDFLARARSVERAQPHLLDEVLAVLLERPSSDSTLTHRQREQVYAALWVAVEALDARWSPAPPSEA